MAIVSIPRYNIMCNIYVDARHVFPTLQEFADESFEVVGAGSHHAGRGVEHEHRVQRRRHVITVTRD